MDKTKSPWLPIVLDRPELFSCGLKLPDPANLKPAHMFEMERTIDRAFEVKSVYRLASLKPPRSQPVAIREVEPHAQTKPHLRNAVTNTLISLPLFAKIYLFSQGAFNDGIHLSEVDGSALFAQSDDDTRVYITRSFLTWSTASLAGDPLFRCDRIVWNSHMPKPAFPAGPVPAQIIVPFARPHMSAHASLEIRSHLMEDLQFLSISRNWGAPLDPMWLHLPEGMTD
jgi:hypothetical protein